jgi:hypothetical protein
MQSVTRCNRSRSILVLYQTANRTYGCQLHQEIPKGEGLSQRRLAEAGRHNAADDSADRGGASTRVDGPDLNGSRESCRPWAMK